MGDVVPLTHFTMRTYNCLFQEGEGKKAFCRDTCHKGREKYKSLEVVLIAHQPFDHSVFFYNPAKPKRLVL